MPAHPHTGPGAEGGGGWPMQATAQPWHAEGRPLPTGADRSLWRLWVASRLARPVPVSGAIWTVWRLCMPSGRLAAFKAKTSHQTSHMGLSCC